MSALAQILLSSTMSSDRSASPCILGERAGKASEIFRVGILRHVAGQHAANRYHGGCVRADE